MRFQLTQVRKAAMKTEKDNNFWQWREKGGMLGTTGGNVYCHSPAGVLPMLVLDYHMTQLYHLGTYPCNTEMFIYVYMPAALFAMLGVWNQLHV